MPTRDVFFLLDPVTRAQKKMGTLIRDKHGDRFVPTIGSPFEWNLKSKAQAHCLIALWEHLKQCPQFDTPHSGCGPQVLYGPILDDV